MESIRKFIDFCGPAVYVVMFLLAGYLVSQAGWRTSTSTWREVRSPAAGRSPVMLVAIALVVAYFSGPMLNFGDFARFGHSFAAVKKGNFLGLPVNFLVFSLLTVITRGHAAGVRRADHGPGRDRRQASTTPSPSCSGR